LAVERLAKARSEHEAAALRVNLESIRRRLAEIEYMHKPLATLLGPIDPEHDRIAWEAERNRIIRAAFYVVHGRFPE
jgi:hypothetical protein